MVVGNIVFMDVKDMRRLHMSKIKYCEMEIVGNIVFGFLMLNLDTLSLKAFLL
jgi:hypothetical protein